MLALLGKKIGMTQMVGPTGKLFAVTVVEAGPCTVTDIRTPDKNGYKAAQIGYGQTKEKHVSKAYKTALAKRKVPLKKYLREIRLDEKEKLEIGHEIKADIFKAGDLVDVQGRTIGKGFAGGVKRWGWGGGPGSHGSMFHKHIGSVGASSFPSRTWPGLKLPGHMGDRTKTIQNLEVIRADGEKNILIIKGPIPGADNGLLLIRQSLKKPQGLHEKVARQKAEAEKKDAGKKKAQKSKK